MPSLALSYVGLILKTDERHKPRGPFPEGMAEGSREFFGFIAMVLLVGFTFGWACARLFARTNSSTRHTERRVVPHFGADLYITSHGECFHTNPECKGLTKRTSSLKKVRACCICATTEANRLMHAKTPKTHGPAGQ